MSIELVIPLENTFNLNEGSYRGRLHNITRKFKSTSKGPEEQVRLLFEMDIPSIKNRVPMTGRTFPLSINPGSELRSFLENWLGRKFFEANSGKKLELESLIGRLADLILIHIHNGGYERPLVVIQSALPPGTLDLTEEPQAMEGKD